MYENLTTKDYVIINGVRIVLAVGCSTFASQIRLHMTANCSKSKKVMSWAGLFCTVFVLSHACDSYCDTRLAPVIDNYRKFKNAYADME